MTEKLINDLILFCQHKKWFDLAPVIYNLNKSFCIFGPKTLHAPSALIASLELWLSVVGAKIDLKIGFFVVFFLVGMVCQMDLQPSAGKLPSDDTAGTVMLLLWHRQVIAHPISKY